MLPLLGKPRGEWTKKMEEEGFVWVQAVCLPCFFVYRCSPCLLWLHLYLVAIVLDMFINKKIFFLVNGYNVSFSIMCFAWI